MDTTFIFSIFCIMDTAYIIEEEMNNNVYLRITLLISHGLL